MTSAPAYTYPVAEAMECIFDNLGDPNATKYRMFYDSSGRPYRLKVSQLTRKKFRVFMEADYTCVKCGRRATEFQLEQLPTPDGDYTGTLVILGKRRRCGKRVSLTIDHIIPKALGGPNDLENYQCMCSVCNHDKGSRYVG